MFTARTIIAATLACLPFLAALVSHGRSQPALLELPGDTRAALAFQQYAVDLGPVTPAPEIRATFVYWNRGTTEVTVDELIPSCGCLAPKIDKTTCKPGEVGKITLRMQPANEKPGAKEYFVDVKYHDSQPREVRLTFRLQLPEHQLTVSPRGLIFYQLNGQPSVQELKVVDTRGSKVEVTGIACSSPLVKLEQKPNRIDDEGIQAAIVAVTVRGDVPRGKHQAVVLLKTDAKDVPELRVPLIIFGPEAPDGKPQVEAAP